MSIVDKFNQTINNLDAKLTEGRKNGLEFFKENLKNVTSTANTTANNLVNKITKNGGKKKYFKNKKKHTKRKHSKNKHTKKKHSKKKYTKKK